MLTNMFRYGMIVYSMFRVRRVHMYQLLLASEYIVSAIVLILALSLFKNNITKPVQYVQFSLIGSFLLNLGYLIEIQCSNADTAFVATKMQYCGSVFIGTFMLFILFEYLKIDLSRVIKEVLIVIDLIILALVITNDYHGLVFQSFTFDNEGLFPHAVFEAGVVRHFFALYILVIDIFIIGVISYYFIHGKRDGKKVPFLFVFAVYLPVIPVILHLTGLIGIVDLSPLFIGISGIFLYMFVQKNMLFEVVNVAMNMVSDNMQDAYIVMDTQMRLLDMNLSAKRLFPELEDGECGTTFVYDKSDILRNIINERPKDIISIGDNYYYATVSEIKNADVLEGYYMHLSDRTAWKKYTDELIKRSVEAEEESEAKSNLLATTTHDIRTPINAIIGMNELIMMESDDPSVIDRASDVEKAGKYLLSLVNNILDVSKIEAGKMNIIEVEFDMALMLREIVTMAGILVSEKKLMLNVNVDENIPHKVLGDEVRIKQIINNIMSNAVKYTERGSVDLNVSVADINDSHVVLRFEVKDSGIGIRKEDISRMLEPFERVDEVRNRKLEGTGLGMTIIVNLLKMMNSKINIESVYNEGSSFWFELQLRIAEAKPIGALVVSDEHSRSKKKTRTINFKAPDAKVLIVDDNRLNIVVLKNLLKMTEVQIDTAMSGEACIDSVRDEAYDIIFMDHMMPGMDGIETLEAINNMQDNKSSNAAVIALTANTISGVERMYKDAGFTDWLSKPAEFDRLESMLYKYLPEDKINICHVDNEI